MINKNSSSDKDAGKGKILILYTSVGLGHKYIALNIAYHLEQAGFEIKLADVLQVQSGVMVNVGEWFHSLINTRFPFVWRWLYFSKAFAKVTMPFRVPLAGKNSEHIQAAVYEFKPDVVIATQTSASAPMAYMKQHGLFNGKFVIAFSDYHFHPYWFYKQADFYLVNIKEQKDALEKLGIPAEKIAVCGITLKPHVQVDPNAVKQKLDLTGRQVVLMSSGSLGIGFSQKLLLDFAKELTTTEPNVQLVVTCGKNETMKHQLEEEAQKQNLNLTALGFYEPMSELFAITDVFLTKPGGLTVAEALRDNIKMITTHFLPGQEELNYEYLTSRKLMTKIPKPMTAKNLVAETMRRMSEKIEVENPNSIEITQKNNEGSALIKSIENLFHNV
ncbi:MAG TPA: glycosyltransferase [Patescibacteria group bacterium]|jgi:processive 1,2-diacylglycerol beta-glucosyltransferase|nr:glycosyltransferase [Patescibacteria group bacterium]